MNALKSRTQLIFVPTIKCPDSVKKIPTSDQIIGIFFQNLITSQSKWIVPTQCAWGIWGIRVRDTKRWGWWRWRGRGKLSVASSISAWLNWPVKSSRLKQMQITLTYLHQKKNLRGFSNQLPPTMVGCADRGEYTVCAPHGTMCGSQTGSCEVTARDPPGCLSPLSWSAAAHKADHHHDSPLLCNPGITRHCARTAAQTRLCNVGVCSLCKTANSET